jgi:DNA-binding transcriptional LysR family regulator
MNMLNARWLDTFTELCETGHFTRTASRLGMTQPGVSQHLRKLEEQLGQTLITRQGKSFTLTPAGEAVLAVGRARRREEQALRRAIESDDPAVGQVKIACSGSFAMLLYPQMMKQMWAAPELMVHLEAMPQESILQGVLSKSFDLGIVARKPEHPRLDAVQIGEEQLCLILPAQDTPEQVTFDGLQARGLVAHPDCFAYADELFALNFADMFRGSDQLRLRTFVNQISQIPAPVAQGIGYTLLPRSGVDAFAERQKLWIVPLPETRLHQLWLVFERGRQLPARVSEMAELVKRVAGGLSAG